MTENPTPIVVEETYAVAPPVVWQAITDPAQMPRWYFEQIKSFRPEVGFETQFTVHFDGRDFVHLWRVTEAVPDKKIAYTFNFEGWPGDGRVVWDLSAVDGGTRLTLTGTGWETFPQDEPAFTREMGVAGWTYFLKDSLKKFLET